MTLFHGVSCSCGWHLSVCRQLCTALVPKCLRSDDRAHSIFRLVRDVTDKEFIWMSADSPFECSGANWVVTHMLRVLTIGFRKLDLCYFSLLFIAFSFTRTHRISFHFVLCGFTVHRVNIWYVNLIYESVWTTNLIVPYSMFDRKIFCLNTFFQWSHFQLSVTNVYTQIVEPLYLLFRSIFVSSSTVIWTVICRHVSALSSFQA
jgi:hypothetical protein